MHQFQKVLTGALVKIGANGAGRWGNTDFFKTMLCEVIQKILIPRVCVPQKNDHFLP